MRWLIARQDKKGGRFYWSPPKRMQTLHELHPRSLGNDESVAIKKAIDLNAAADKRIHEGRPALPLDKIPGSWGWLIDAFTNDTDFLSLAPSTQNYYREECKQVRALIGDMQILGTDEKGQTSFVVSRLDVKTTYKTIKVDNNQPRRAEKIVRTIQRLYSFAHDMDPRTYPPSPYLRMKLGHERKGKTRWRAEDVAAFCFAAVNRKVKAAGNNVPLPRPSMSLAVRLAQFTAAREVDVISATHADVVSPVVDFTNGRVIAKVGFYKLTSKRKVKVAIPITDEKLASELLDAAKRMGPLIVNEATGEAWTERAFQATFAAIRDDAGLPSTLVFKNLRHSRLQAAADGGASRDQLRGLAGHTNYKSTEAYIWPTSEQAMGAIDAAERTESENKVSAKLNGSPEKS